MKHKPLSKEQIIEILDEFLEVEFSFVKNEVPAEQILTLPRQQQEFILNLVKRVADTNIELAYQLACNCVYALEGTDTDMVEEWAMTATDIYDRKGLFPAMSVIRDLDHFPGERVRTSH